MSTRNRFRRDAILLSLAFVCLATSPIEAGDRRRVLAISRPAPALEISFIEGQLLDAGSITAAAQKVAKTAKRLIRIRIGAPSREPNGTATVRAFLETPDPRCTIRIDGVVLGATPRVIRRNAPVGVVFTHRIEIEVPDTAAEGPLQMNIGWEVTTE